MPKLQHLKVSSLAILSLSASAVMLTACAGPGYSSQPTLERNVTQIAETIERLEIYTRQDGLTLSLRDQMAVSQFLQNYSHNGTGPLLMNMPGLAPNHPSLVQAKSVVNNIMIENGIPTQGLKYAQYQSRPGSPAPIVISYNRLKVVPQDCRQMGSLTHTFSNQTSKGFGCFDRANLAAMIEDPRQLLQPYDMTPPDMQRRMVVYDRYIQGENPASQQPERQQVSSEE